ncbi:MAG: hypothetical protein JKY52_09140 [Flavobacteriales bacterium]|nr:hypothetical protein [Flavobacteriales bacterium]
MMISNTGEQALKTKQFNLRMDLDVIAWVNEQALKDDRTPGIWLSRFINQHMGKVKPAKKQQTTMPAVSRQWVVPAGLNCKAWAEFDQHRRKHKSAWTDLAKTKSANILLKLTHDQQQVTVDNSVQAGWPGLYPEKLKNTKSFIEQQNDSTFDSLFGNDQGAIEGECHAG